MTSYLRDNFSFKNDKRLLQLSTLKVKPAKTVNNLTAGTKTMSMKIRPRETLSKPDSFYRY